VGAPYTVTGRGDGEVTLTREGTVDGRRVRVEKRYRIELGGRLEVRYRLSLLYCSPRELVFSPELSLTLLDGHSAQRTYRLPDRDPAPEERKLASRGVFSEVGALSLVNEANRFRVDLTFGGARPTVWRFPLETVSNSEAGFERTYQGSVILPRFAVRLDA